MRVADSEFRAPAAADGDPQSRHGSAGAGELWASELHGLHAEVERVHWWFRARRRILEGIARRILGDARATVVDIGCGTGGNIAALASSYSCIGIDPAADAIRLARRRYPGVEFLVGDVPADLPAHSGDADLFMLTDVLEHVDDDSALLAALVERAKPGSHLMITVPANPSLWSHHDVTLGHRRRYDRAMLARLWDGLPVTVRLLSAFNARLYPVIRAARTFNRLRGRASGLYGTDVLVPARPVNALLERVFAGERTRLSAALDGRRVGYLQGVSSIAVLRRDAEANRRIRDIDGQP